ncbi:MAG: M15 family metallopeptidase [Gemmatimonadota bacterium]|nr:MAG: M15 family metallopeptidase [Gemmatimonadota bacterium]
MTPKDAAKAIAYNQKQLDAGEITAEHITALTFEYQTRREDLADDGMLGPLTRNALDISYTDDGVPEGGWQSWDGPLDEQPVNRRTTYDMFGDPGKYEQDKAWARDNIMECHERLGNRLPGVPSKWWVKVHKAVEPYLREGLRRAQLSAPEYQIERLGGYVWRAIRHRRGNPLSMHSWGIAIDIDPHRNFSRKFAKGEGPEAWSPAYMAIWPDGLPEPFVRAMQSCGFAWGSDWDEDGLSHDHTYYDAMHFEWVARDGHANGV